jgi:hypothetical protein
MKKSEIELTGDVYRLTPANLGCDTFITNVSLFSEDYSDEIELVNIAKTKDGEFYALLDQYESLGYGRRKQVGTVCRPCQAPRTIQNGVGDLYGKWERLEV